ncbi:protocadherin-9-like isoform X2 [Littorina saxatilis]|uniref:protocadherin-9-like isoform X2 n=1 Tax=Littorina saxatilis TaxID=31220 RepID=UPI0038B64398
MKTKKICRTLLLVFFFLYLPAFTEEASVTYQLREEQDSGTFVGNIERDMLLQGELEPQDVVNLKYQLSSAGNPKAALFTMNESSSTITTSQRIDREEVCPGKVDCHISLDIAVYKSGSSLDLFKLWNADVNINDINDNSPTFPQPVVSLSVPESVPPMHTLHTSGAEDKDKGGNNSVQGYRLSPSNPLFDINVVDNPDGSTDLGIVIKQQLDREKQEFYQLKVEVVDGGYPQRTGSLTVNITVADINDERPTFQQSTYNVSVQENVAPNVQILQVSASDQDVGFNGEVTYSFSPRVAADVKSRLQIDTRTGSISARGPIDYEDKKRYQFLVEAKDKGSPQLSGGTVVILNVEDVNDNAPQININLMPGGSNLTESEAVGKFIAHVSVSDRDSGQNSLVICSMDDDYFDLKKFYDHAYNMYKVVLSHALDYEAARAHRLTITCRDRGDPMMANSTSFTVNVRDVNDNAPVFAQQTYTASVVENQLGVRDLIQVSAHDSDTGPGGEVDYALDSTTPNITRIFSLNSQTGVLQVRSALNREDRGRYVFHVLAYDRGTPKMTSSATVVITVLDQNDEKPYFTRSLFDCYVLERQPAGTRVGNVSAIDSDSSEHSNMRYTIVAGVGDYQLFSMEPGTGVIKSRAVFDREDRPLYRFMVKVEDPNVPVFYDLANVTVQVLDDNDNPPVVHYPKDGNNSINVVYGTRVGWVLLMVNATDGDEGVFGKISYSIADGDSTHLFDLNQHTGALRLARTILPADVQTHVLDLKVQDGGDPPLFRNSELHVHIIAGNMSLVSPDDDKDKNMMIVIILVCVTAVLALAVIITICIIRRIDRERKARRAASKAAEEEKMFHLKNQDAFMTMTLSPDSSSGSGDSSQSNGGVAGQKNKRKEVSFSIDEGVDSLNTSSGSANNAMSTFKSPMDKHKELNSTDNGLSVVNYPSLRSEPGMLNIQVGRRMSSDDNQLHTVREEEEACQYINILKRNTNGEDALSESSGETGTSDSGRGGSEDDSHSNRGSATIDPALRNIGLYDTASPKP